MIQTTKKKINYNPCNEEIEKFHIEYNALGLVYYTPLEELLNTLTHGLGIFLGIAGLVLALLKTTNPRGIALSAIVCSGFIILYATSAVYHALRNTELKRKVRKLDHASVIIVIISSGAAIVLATPSKTINYIILGLCYFLTAINYAGCIIKFEKFKNIALINDFLAGGLLAFAYFLNRQFIPFSARMCYLASLIFTLSSMFFYCLKKRYAHTIFHILTFIGSACCIIATLIMI